VNTAPSSTAGPTRPFVFFIKKGGKTTVFRGHYASYAETYDAALELGKALGCRVQISDQPAPSLLFRDGRADVWFQALSGPKR
jgi:hypothetical protein